LTITWDDNTTTEYKLGYQEFFRTGMQVDNIDGGKIIAGSYYDINNQPIKDTSVIGQERQFFSDSPDGSSLIHINGASVSGVANPVFHVVQFEYTLKIWQIKVCTASCHHQLRCLRWIRIKRRVIWH